MGKDFLKRENGGESLLSWGGWGGQFIHGEKEIEAILDVVP